MFLIKSIQGRHFPVLFLWLLAGTLSCYGQKKAIGIEDLGNWPTVGQVNISSDGKYVLFYINNLTNQRPTGQVLELRSIANEWRLQIPNAMSGAQFSADSKLAIVMVKGDTLLIIKTGTNTKEAIAGVSSFKMKGKWLAYQQKDSGNSLQLLDCNTTKNITYSGTIQYLFNNNGNALLLETKDSTGVNALQWVDLVNNSRKCFWKGKKANSIRFDATGRKLAFIIPGTAEEEIWYFKDGEDSAHKLMSGAKVGDQSLTYALRNFSQDGQKLFVEVTEPMPAITKNNEAIEWQVWNSTSSKLYTQRKLEGIRPKTYRAVFELNTGKMIRLDEHLETITASNDRYILLASRQGDADLLERTWNPALKKSMFIASVADGKKKSIPFQDGPIMLSPEGKYLLNYDAKKGNYYTYDLKTGKVTNITATIQTKWTMAGNDNVDSIYAVPSLAITWLKGDSGILINDRYDVWLLDPLAETAPENITNGFGKKKGIQFYIVIDPGKNTFDRHQKLLLSAFNTTTKENGFFSKMIGLPGDPIQLTMAPNLYFVPFGPLDDRGMLPIKADSAEIYIVKRMDASNSPNYFSTKDFISFQPVSDIHPEKEYNWLRAELVTWKGLDKRPIQGILYKPENFDPTKKYPLIFYYYEKLSNNFHLYRSPQPAIGNIDIPYMVSNGYLVFTPDIHYQVGNPGYSAVNSVISAARILGKRAYIDSNRMGIQGHSFGGYETNFIITQSKLFAAACSSAGPSDLISHYGSLNGAGAALQGAYEIGQFRMKVSPWENPRQYIANSPILQVDKVSTPILLNYNKEDDVIPFAQGIEFFTALRRVGKKAWLLAYEKEGHIITNEKTAIDYTVRLKQFFDHFLMGKPMPEWMSNQ